MVKIVVDLNVEMWYHRTIDQHCPEDTALMPRKPRLGNANLHVEGLSSGKVGHEVIIDDFTGQPIAPKTPLQVQPAGASDEYRTRQSRLKQAQREAEQARKHKVLVDTGIIKREPRLVEVVPKGKRKVAEFNGLAVLVDIPKWRRV